MSLLSILFAILLRPSVLVFLGVLAVLAVSVFYISGPKALLKWALDARVWLAIAGFSTILAIGDLKKENTALKAEVAQHAFALQGKEDAQATLEVRHRAREARTRESTTIRDATSRSSHQPEEVIDATLDAIAQVQAGGLDGRKRPDSQPQPERVRNDQGKQPDGNVAP